HGGRGLNQRLDALRGVDLELGFSRALHLQSQRILGWGLSVIRRDELGLHREIACTVWGELHTRGVVLQRAGDPLAVDQELHGAFCPLRVFRRGDGRANADRLTGANWAGLIRAQLDGRTGDGIDRDRSAGRARRECAARRGGELRGDLLLPWVRAGGQLSGGDTRIHLRRHRRITQAETDGALGALRHGGLDLHARTRPGHSRERRRSGRRPDLRPSPWWWRWLA